MRAGAFTVGDLALFVYYLTFVTQFITNVGKFITYFKQMSVSLERLTFLLQGASARVLTMVNSLHLKAEAAVSTFPLAQKGRANEGLIQEIGIEHEIAVGAKVEERFNREKAEASLQRLDVNGLSYAYSDTGRGISDIHFSLKRGSLPSLRERLVPAKPRLFARSLGCFPRERERLRGMVCPSKIRAPSLHRRGALIPRRCRGYTAIRCAIIFCSGKRSKAIACKGADMRR